VRRNAKKRAKEDRSVQADRAAFRAEFPHCWHCGAFGTVCDEMVSGMSDRVKGVQHRECWTALCSTCNEHVLNGSATWIVLVKLAYKAMFDRRWYKPMKVSVLKGKKRTAYTRADVAMFMCQRLDGGKR
jgi:hypothetical protein